MSDISVAHGWHQILDEAVEEASRLPPEWCFEISSAETVDGALKISATYVSGDIPIDDHLPPERKLPHPWRSMMRIREAARAASLVTCECCGREGQLVGAGHDARVRCVRHEYVVDVEQWEEKRASMTYAFEAEDEAMEYFLRDYGAGLELMQGLQRDPDESDPETKN